MRKSTIGNAMSKILADIDDDEEVLRAKGIYLFII